MAETGASQPRILVAIAAFFIFASVGARASQESRRPRDASSALARRASRFAAPPQFGRYCASCHGPASSGRCEPVQSRRWRVSASLIWCGNWPILPARSATAIPCTRYCRADGIAGAANLGRHRGVSQSGRRCRGSAQTGNGAQLALGRDIFREQCASCHRGDAHGDDDGFVPSLRNQHYPYLVNQMHKLGEGRRHNVDADLVRFLGNFDDRDIKATADYLSRLQGRGAVHKIMRDDGVVVD